MNLEQVTIRELKEDVEMRTCMDLQQRVWGSSELEVVPHYIFVVARRTGGQVLGAFVQDQMVGFLLGFAAWREGRTYLHSHMTAVLPEFQGRGIGKKLKLAQRQNALDRGFDLIEWTFDPLQIGNANFNMNHLGAVVREYLPNIYGGTTSRLDSGLPTDRMVAEWWIRHARVEQILNRQALKPASQAQRVEMPRNIREICKTNPEKARQIQNDLRSQVQLLFTRSFAVTAFELDAQHASYILELYED